MSGSGGGLVSPRAMVEAPMMFRAGSGGASATRNSFINCAKCGAPGRIRRSAHLSEVVTQLDVHCTDTACGHTWRADIVFVHSICEGNIDRPDLNLKVCPPEKRVHVRPPSGEDDDDQCSMFEPPGDCSTATTISQRII